MTDHWTLASVAHHDESAFTSAMARQGELTKPPGSLGRLESLAVQLAAMQGRDRPSVDRVRIVIFAGDHGVAAEEQVSAFPPAVTVEMVKNFSRGGAAISVLSKSLGATLEVVNVGTVGDPGSLPGVVDRRVGPGTANLATGAAMTGEQLDASLDAGKEAVERAVEAGCDLFIGGEMGIGNTTAAAAVGGLTLGLSGAAIAGPGTGLDEAGVSHKAAVIDRALALHADHRDGSEPLRRVGGFEIAALTGAYIACAQKGIPVLVDGFITTAAALAAMRINPGVADWLLYSHASAEPGSQVLLTALGARPLVDLSLRLGEASGAATCVPLLRLACAIHNGMATFAEAGVSGAV